MIFAFGSARGCPTHQLGDCLVCGAEMIRQGPSWRFRDKDTYYTQERRSDMTINFTELRDDILGTPMSLPNVCRCVAGCENLTYMTDTEMALGDAADGEGVFKIDVDALSDEALDAPCLFSGVVTLIPTPLVACGVCRNPGGLAGAHTRDATARRCSDAKSNLMHR